MTNNELVKCSEVVIYFLLHCEEEYDELHHFDTPSNEIMSIELRRHNIRMIDIPVMLNCKLHIQNEPLWIHSPKEFFSDHDKSVFFFKKAISLLTRKQKLQKIKSKICI